MRFIEPDQAEKPSVMGHTEILNKHFSTLKENIFHENIITALVGSVSAAVIVSTTEGSVGPLTKWFLRYDKSLILINL